MFWNKKDKTKVEYMKMTDLDELMTKRTVELLESTGLEGLTIKPTYDTKYSRVRIYFASAGVTITDNAYVTHHKSAELTAKILLEKVNVSLQESKEFLEAMPTVLESLALLAEEVEALTAAKN